jgi:short-subunit dehydrogenase
MVIGASSGIGRACALRFAEREDHLILAARSANALRTVEAECSESGAADVRTVAMDVLDDDGVNTLIDTATAAHGRIDVVVFSAGVMAYGTIEDVPAAVFTRVVDTAVHGTANVARAVLPLFRTQDAGTLIVVTSLLASIPLPQMGAYITGKWGQLGLARILQLETRDDADINVCTVSPGAVDTPIYRSAANFAGRVGRPPAPVSSPDHVADAVLRCADRPRKNISVGPTNTLITLGFRLAPPVFDALAGPLLRLVALSKETVEPTTGNVFDPDAVQRPPVDPVRVDGS